MSRYELLVFLHIAAVIIWLGAGFVLTLLVFGAERSGDRMKEAGHHADVGWLAPRLFIPASLGSVVFGVLVVVDGPWTFDQLWIVIGLAGWAASFGLGFFYFRPEAERIGALVEQHGPSHPEIGRRVRRLNVVDRLQLLLLFLVVADMVMRPTGDDGGLLVAGAAILVAATALALTSIRRDVAAPAGAAPQAEEAG